MKIDFTKLPPLSIVRGFNPKIPKEMRVQIPTLIKNVLQGFYAHLPIKMARHASNPIQALDLLIEDLSSDYSITEYFNILLDIVNNLKDRHTTLTLPRPWNQWGAILPFFIFRYYENDVAKYMIKGVSSGYENSNLIPGSLITHWNGIPIDDYVSKLMAAKSQGSNQSSASQLATTYLTYRPLSFNLPPNEDWVTLTLLTPKNELRSASVLWRLYSPDQSGHSLSPEAHTQSSGLDPHLFVVTDLQRKSSGQKEKLKKWKDILIYGTKNIGGKSVGYIKVNSFEVGTNLPADVNEFINELASNILPELPQDRLIIDLRNNPGGIIPSGQKFVQLLSSSPITTSPLEFRMTDQTRFLVERMSQMDKWKYSFSKMAQTGINFSQAFSITDLSDMPRYRYPGNVALIVDGLSYSTCNFFSADFKDNKVGVIISTTEKDGAGGGNPWNYNVIASNYNILSKKVVMDPLPLGINLTVAVRRSLRTGLRAGMPVEDLGTSPDFIHKPTFDDVMNNDVDLFAFATSKI